MVGEQTERTGGRSDCLENVSNLIGYKYECRDMVRGRVESYPYRS